MNTEILISIIVPVFQVEKYIKRCLDSILSQTYHNFELILVDDGSTDKSGAICDDYQQIDNRIRVFHTKNQGVSKARKYGVQMSKGDYIIFVDSDDYIPQNSIAELFKYRNNYNLDIVIGGFNICDDNHHKYSPIKTEIINQQEYTKRLLQHNSNPGPCGKLYKKRLISDESFFDIVKGEDYLMNLEISLKVKHVGYINTPVYNYYQRNNSVIHLHKTNLAYEKEYNQLTKNILHEKVNYYMREFLTFSINQIYTIFINKGTFDSNDDWIKDIIFTSKKYNLTFKEYITIKAINFKTIRNIIANSRILYCKIFRI